MLIDNKYMLNRWNEALTRGIDGYILVAEVNDGEDRNSNQRGLEMNSYEYVGHKKGTEISHLTLELRGLISGMHKSGNTDEQIVEKVKAELLCSDENAVMLLKRCKKVYGRVWQQLTVK